MRKILIVLIAVLSLLMVVPTTTQAVSGNKHKSKAESTVNNDQQPAQNSADQASICYNKA